MEGRLFRSVSQLDFMAGNPPAYLFTSRRPGRCNPRGVECVYFAETEEVADVEYRGRWKGTDEFHKPKLTFVARIRLAHVLDLADQEVRERLVIGDAELFGVWRGRRTKLQDLGLAVSKQTRLAAIRFPSAAMRREGRTGWNVVVFKASVRAPDSLEILGESGNAIEIWP